MREQSVRELLPWTCFLFATFVALVVVRDVQARKRVDTSTIAPEFRAVAEQRRADQLKQMACAKKVDEEGWCRAGTLPTSVTATMRPPRGEC